MSDERLKLAEPVHSVMSEDIPSNISPDLSSKILERRNCPKAEACWGF